MISRLNNANRPMKIITERNFADDDDEDQGVTGVDSIVSIETIVPDGNSVKFLPRNAHANNQ